MGKWSYSIYLWHWPLVALSAMDAVLERRPLAGLGFVVVGSVVLGWASFTLVESRPRSRTRFRVRTSIMKPLLAFGIAGLAAAGVAASGDYRMPSRNHSTPTGLAAEADYFPASCSNYQKQARDVHPCRIERQGHRTVLVIGDSFAEHLYPWFETHSLVPVDFLAEAGCPPVPHFDRLQAGFHCLDFARLVWRAALEPRYDTVVISGNWSMVGSAGPPYCHETGTGKCTLLACMEKREAVLAEMKAAIQELLAAGKTVVVLDVAPIAYVSVPQRIERELFWFGTPRFHNSRQALLADNEWIDSLFAEFRDSPGYHLLSLRPALCDASTCKPYDPDLKRSIYVDDRHFDPVWMAKNGGIFTPFVQPLRAP